MTIEEMKARRRELGYTYEKLSQVSGVPLGTVQKVLGGVTKSPRYDTIRALEQALSAPREMAAQEDGPEIKTDAFTLADYYALPEERRAELIDGKFYDMATPAITHQIIAGRIFACFLAHIDGGKGKCVPLVSPVDVQLDQDDRTMVQPDVLILCDRAKLRRNVICGAPDLIVEILSKSSMSKDMIIKLNKYYQAGVREYWMVDPEAGKIRVYQFNGEESSYQEYERDDAVPVGIWNGKCRVDFGEIFAYLDSLDMPYSV